MSRFIIVKKITNKVYFSGHRKTSSVSFEPISGAHLSKNYASFGAFPQLLARWGLTMMCIWEEEKPGEEMIIFKGVYCFNWSKFLCSWPPSKTGKIWLVGENAYRLRKKFLLCFSHTKVSKIKYTNRPKVYNRSDYMPIFVFSVAYKIHKYTKAQHCVVKLKMLK